jgi:hypothetical protein
LVPSPAGPVDLVIFHSLREEPLRRDLETYLTLLKRAGAIGSFSAHSIDGIDEDARARAGRIASARVFVVLVSESLLVSDFFKGPELAQVVERGRRDEAIVVCVYARPCEWERTWMRTLQLLPRPDRHGERRPVSQRDHDEVWFEITKELRSLIEKLRKKTA